MACSLQVHGDARCPTARELRAAVNKENAFPLRRVIDWRGKNPGCLANDLATERTSRLLFPLGNGMTFDELFSTSDVASAFEIIFDATRLIYLMISKKKLSTSNNVNIR